jgi:hypothetical protein
MKILRKNNDFKKVPDKSVGDILLIQNLINQGWNYCPKQVYKEYVKGDETKQDLEREKKIKNKKNKR